eukprot:scaffold46886_cov28-Tisochrysis_lutea.AAC.9
MRWMRGAHCARQGTGSCRGWCGEGSAETQQRLRAIGRVPRARWTWWRGIAQHSPSRHKG